MSQQKQEELPEGSAPVKKSKIKRFVILFALLLLLGGGGFGAYWFISNNPELLESIFPSDDSEGGEESGEGSEKNPENAGADGSTPSTTIQTAPTHLVSLPPLTINLADTGVSRYLRVGIDIEVSNKDAIAIIENQSARIRDAIIILLSSKTYESLATTEGKFQLKNEIASRINQIIGTPRVLQIYFTDFVVQ